MDQRFAVGGKAVDLNPHHSIRVMVKMPFQEGGHAVENVLYVLI